MFSSPCKSDWKELSWSTGATSCHVAENILPASSGEFCSCAVVCGRSSCKNSFVGKSDSDEGIVSSCKGSSDIINGTSWSEGASSSKKSVLFSGDTISLLSGFCCWFSTPTKEVDSWFKKPSLSDWFGVGSVGSVLSWALRLGISEAFVSWRSSVDDASCVFSTTEVGVCSA